jgi:hypothetical protein
MAAQRRNMPEQEHSIKVRSHELFVEETPVGPAKATKPFKVFLKETPARPLSAGFRALLWALGITVGLLFLLALWRLAQRHQTRIPATGAAPAATAMFREMRRSPGAGFLRT